MIQRTINADGRCVFGSTVVLEDVEKGDVVTYQIVGDDEADIRQRKISISSPIARAHRQIQRGYRGSDGTGRGAGI